MELVELTNSETAAATPPGEGAKSLRSPSLLENGRCWRLLVNYPSYIYTIPSGMVFGTQSSQGHHQGHHQSGKSDENRSSEPNQIAPSVYIMIELCYFCRSLTKVKFSTNQVRPALGSGSWLVGWWIVNHAQKPENGPISDHFNPTQNTFCLYCLILT